VSSSRGPVDPLRGVPIFAALPDAARSELALGAPRRHLSAGEWLFREGEPATSLFAVLSGRLEVVAEDQGGAVMREIGRGAAVGELALLTGHPRSASVRARRDSELLEVEASRFDALLSRDPAPPLALARTLAAQLRESRGIAPILPLPGTIAVLPAPERGGDAPACAARLAEELRRNGRVALLRAESAGSEEAWPGALDAAEAGGGQVLLVSGDPAGAWAEFCRRQADRVVTVGSRDPDVAALARRLSGRAIGVVLSGGGARGLAHIGVLEALLDAGVTIDRVGGTSMGALIGAQLALGRAPAEIRELCRAELVDRNPLGDYTVPRVALTRGRRGRAMLGRLLGDVRIEDLPRDFFCVSSDLVSARLVVHREGSLAEAVAASVTLPGILPPAVRDEAVLVDGGVLDNLPVAEMAASGEGPVIAIDVTARFTPPPPGQRIGIRDTLLRTLTLGSSNTAAAAQRHADLVIEPDVSGVGMLAFDRLDDLVARGREAAQSALQRSDAIRTSPVRSSS
jgi:NTE family protein